MNICVLRSGSKGNCAAIWSKEGTILIDMVCVAVRNDNPFDCIIHDVKYCVHFKHKSSLKSQ